MAIRAGMSSEDAAEVLRARGNLDVVADIAEKDALDGNFFVGLGKNATLLDAFIKGNKLKVNVGLTLTVFIDENAPERAEPSRVEKRKADANKKLGKKEPRTPASTTPSSSTTVTVSRRSTPTPAARAASTDSTRGVMSQAELLSTLSGYRDGSASSFVKEISKTAKGLTNFNKDPRIFVKALGRDMDFKEKGGDFVFQFTTKGFKKLKDLAGDVNASILTPQLVWAAFRKIYAQHKQSKMEEMNAKAAEDLADFQELAKDYESVEDIEAACDGDCEELRQKQAASDAEGRQLFLAEKISAADFEKAKGERAARVELRISEKRSFYRRLVTAKEAAQAPGKKNGWNTFQRLAKQVGASPRTTKEAYDASKADRNKKSNNKKTAAAESDLRAQGYDADALKKPKKGSKPPPPRNDDDDDDSHIVDLCDDADDGDDDLDFDAVAADDNLDFDAVAADDDLGFDDGDDDELDFDDD